MILTSQTAVDAMNALPESSVLMKPWSQKRVFVVGEATAKAGW